VVGKSQTALAINALHSDRRSLGDPAVADPAVGRQVLVEGAGLAHGDELAVLAIELAHLVFQQREEPGLDGVPQVA
jgi:hypothetical protein